MEFRRVLFPSLASWRQFRLGSGDMPLHFDKAVLGNGHRIDAAFDQKAGKFRVIARRLSAQANLGTVSMGFLNNMADHPFDRRILLVELARQQFGITVDSERELSQIIAADRESVKPLGKRYREHHV